MTGYGHPERSRRLGRQTQQLANDLFTFQAAFRLPETHFQVLFGEILFVQVQKIPLSHSNMPTSE
ncbi:hypothetical protein L1281_000437 [Neisseria sp. HSC-16F19]|nr:hypothetical protein [Neisseria sp. HSC-16F19]MCP2039858.1 hypothetical protein [Neisseria sp. HSC-16F19]